MSANPTTESPTSLNAQDFSGSDDEILDNFAEGPQPGDPPPLDDTHDDGTPMGLGGEKGKQSEPASSTLEADMANDTKPGEEVPPEGADAREPAASEPATDEGEEVDDEVPSADTQEPETPDFPPVLLQMAGYPDAKAAQEDGFGTPEALHAYIRGRGQLLTSEEEGPLYGRSSEEASQEEEESGIEPFELPEETLEILDDDLAGLLRQMNEHYQKEVQSIRSTVSQQVEQEQDFDDVEEFDQAVQNLGEQWQDTFGDGPGTELADKAKRDPVAMAAFRNRDELFDAVQTLRETSARKGLAPMALQQEIQFALMQRHPDTFQQAISGKSSGKSRGISRPTQRKTPPRTQNDKTVADVNAMLRKKGRPKLTADPHDDFDGEI